MQFKLKAFNTPINVSRIANIHYFEFTNQYHTNDDSHHFCELVYVDKGEISVRSENFTGILYDNQLIIHRPDEVHSLKCTDAIAPNIIIIGFECDSSELEKFAKNPVTLANEQQKMLAEIMKEGMSVYAPPYDLPNTTDMKKREVYPFGADQMIKLKLEIFLITLIRFFSSPEQISKKEIYPENELLNVYQYIKEHYTEKITLDNLCFLFGTNKTTLCQCFKKQYGDTILNYINTLRIKEAKTLLRKNELSVTEISEKLGFSSIHYFCRIFKKATGNSPKEYLKTIRSKLEIL